MSFVERLKQEEAATATREQQLKTLQEVERLRRETVEKERHAKRNQQAENFREESSVGSVVAELGGFLATPTIPVAHDNGESEWTEYTGRGSSSRGLKDNIKLTPRDSDSAFDSIVWDYKHLGFSGYTSHHSRKFIVVETCPDGTIMFHAGWSGSTTIPYEKWKGKDDRRNIFDNALEKAYKHPAVMKYDSKYIPMDFG